MRTAISAIIIKNGEILIVSEGDGIWALPGGKPKNEDKNEIETLQRECQEEISVEIKSPLFYKEFLGLSPRIGDKLLCKTYFAEIEDSPQPNMEIKEIKWTKEPKKYQLSDITSKIISSLYQGGYLKD